MSCPFPLREQMHIHTTQSQVGQSPRTPESPSGWARTGSAGVLAGSPPFRHTPSRPHITPRDLKCTSTETVLSLVISNSGVTRTQRMINREEGTQVFGQRGDTLSLPMQNTGPGTLLPAQLRQANSTEF